MRPVLVGAMLAVLLTTFGTLVSPARHALAASVVFSNDDVYQVLGPNSPITISGDLTGGCVDQFGQYSTNVYILPHGTIDPSVRTLLPPTPNAVIIGSGIGGAYIDEIIGQTGPSGKIGGVGSSDWDIALDLCADGYFDPNEDYLAGVGTPHGAFTVTIPANVPVLPAGSLSSFKSDALKLAQDWTLQAKNMVSVFQAYDLTKLMLGCAKPTPIEVLSCLAGSPDAVKKTYETLTCSAIPVDATVTSINGYLAKCSHAGADDVMRLQGPVLNEILLEVKHYSLIAADPADPTFANIVALGPVDAPTAQTDVAAEAAAATVGDTVSLQQTELDALLHSVEKYQGAQQVGDGQDALLQAQGIVQYASLAAASVPDLDSSLSNLGTSLSSSGVDLDQTGQELAVLRQWLVTSGFTTDEIAHLLSLGFTMTQIAQMSAVLSESAANAPASANATLDSYQPGALAASTQSIVGDNAAALADLQHLASDMQPVVASLQSQITSSLPLAVARGPYSGSVGTAISFDGSASSTPAGTGPLTYAWDMTGSGAFTDATGPTPSYNFTSPRNGLVGLLVTNAQGLQSISYAPITINATTARPTLGPISPGPDVSVPPGGSQTFTATATNPDGSTPSYQWLLDGAQVGTSTSYTAAFSTTDIGLHVVTVKVTNGAGSVQQQAGVEVANPVTLSSLIVSPQLGAPVGLGASGHFFASANFSNGSTADVSRSVTWTSSNTAVATVDVTGNVTTTGLGTATITASAGTASGSSTIVVSGQGPTLTSPTLISLTLTPSASTLLTLGTLQMHAAGIFSDGSTQDETAAVTWTSSNPQVLSVSSTGLVTANQPGTAIITAALGGTATATQIVVPTSVTLQSIVVNPTGMLAPTGTTLQYRATGVYSNGTVSDLTATATWASSNGAVATVDNTGKVSVISSGTTQISAAFLGVSATVSLTGGAVAAGGARTFYVTERSNWPNAVAKVTLDNSGNATVQNNFVTGLPHNGPDGLLFDHEGRLLVSNPDAGTISLVDPATGAVLVPQVVNQIVGLNGEVVGPANVYMSAITDMTLDPNSDTIYAILWHGNELLRISLKDGTGYILPNTVSILGGVALSADGTRLFVSGSTSANGSGVFELDPQTGSILRFVAVNSPDGMTYDPSTGHLFVSSGQNLAELSIGSSSQPDLTSVGSYPVAVNSGLNLDGVAADGLGHVYVIQFSCCLVRFDIATHALSPIASNIPSADDVAPLVGAGAPPPPPPVTTPSQATTLTYAGDTSGTEFQLAHLTAHLVETAGGQPVAGAPVSLQVGSQGCSAITDTSGNATCEVTMDQPAATLPITAHFAGATPDLPADASGTFDLGKETPKLTLSAPAATQWGAPLTLAATVQGANGAGRPGQSLTFVLGSGSTAQTCAAVTAMDGTAACSIVPVSQAVGSANITVSYAGSDREQSASAIGATTVSVPTAVAYTGDVSGDYHDQARLRAQLVDTSASPAKAISGASLTFTLGSATCSARTDNTGVASCTVTLADAPGTTQQGSVSYAGDTTHTPASTLNPFAIVPEQSMVWDKTAAFFLAGTSLQLSGVLKEDGTVPIVGRLVTLTLGSGSSAMSCNATTGNDGTASCPVTPPANLLGPTSVTVRFTGDAEYQPSTATGTATGYGIMASGTFAVGDASAFHHPGNTLTFWGAQWSLANSLLGGTAPSDFKGYIASVPMPLTLTTKWSTLPGNSPDPTASVPAFMAVLVTSKVTEAGSTISGNVVAIAIVETDPGYSSDPGHSGTGSLVGFVRLAS